MKTRSCTIRKGKTTTEIPSILLWNSTTIQTIQFSILRYSLRTSVVKRKAERCVASTIHSCTSPYQASHVQIRWTVCFRMKHALSAYSMNALHACKQFSLFPRFVPNLDAYFQSFRYSRHVAALSTTDQPSYQPSSFFSFLSVSIVLFYCRCS